MRDQTIYYTSKRRQGRRFSKKNGKRTTKNTTQHMRLMQLVVCLALFMTMVIGKGIFPDKLRQVHSNIVAMISSDTDFVQAFSDLGASLSEGGSLVEKIEDFCVEVFGAGEGIDIPTEQQTAPQMANFFSNESRFLTKYSDQKELSTHFLNQANTAIPLDLTEKKSTVTENTQTESAPKAVAAAGTVLLKTDYNGEQLPEHYTMDQLSLGALETETPVLGHINSVYGYRDHPINGKYQFHGGVDIGGQRGEAIKAFSSGVVEYVGKDDSYGLYLQIDHANGIKSFYAHCDSIDVSKGQQVAMGETIAHIGSTGAATGPHLHLELKFGKMHMNPIYYIDYLSDQ